MVSKPTLIIDTEAQLEIEKAIEWYEKEREGLGFEFYKYLLGYLKRFKKMALFFK